jgi:hypothetical protein
MKYSLHSFFVAIPTNRFGLRQYKTFVGTTRKSEQREYIKSSKCSLPFGQKQCKLFFLCKTFTDFLWLCFHRLPKATQLQVCESDVQSDGQNNKVKEVHNSWKHTEVFIQNNLACHSQKATRQNLQREKSTNGRPFFKSNVLGHHVQVCYL